MWLSTFVTGNIGPQCQKSGYFCYGATWGRSEEAIPWIMLLLFPGGVPEAAGNTIRRHSLSLAVVAVLVSPNPSKLRAQWHSLDCHWEKQTVATH